MNCFPNRYFYARLPALAIFTLFLASCGGGGGSNGVSAPAAVQVAPGGGANSCDISAGGCTLSWSQVIDTRVTGYRVYIDSTPPVTVVNAEFFVDVPGATVVTFNFSIQSLTAVNAVFTAGSQVSIAVSATGANGIESPLSVPLTTTL